VVVVDCETTGVYNSDRVVEIALVTLDLDGNVVECWDSLVRPGRDVGPTHIHGLTADDLKDAPTFGDIAGDVALRLHGACLAAHNLPFDTRMLGGEYERLGWDLSVSGGLDTLAATRRRLALACAERGVALDSPHAARHDALATAQLLLAVTGYLTPGGPASAPIGIAPAGRVQPRGDGAFAYPVDPPHIAALAAQLDLDGLEASMLSYLDVVGRAVADLHLDRDERAELDLLAGSLGLTASQRAQAHRRLVNDLVDAAVADHVLTDDELDVLLRVSSALEVDEKTFDQRTRPARTTSIDVEMAAGQTVVFTGDHPTISRQTLERHAHKLGLTVGANVTKTTTFVVAADVDSDSGKAAKARTYGLPIIAADHFRTAAAGSRLAGSAVAARKVVTCPDCHATSTMPSTAKGKSTKRCAECAASSR
jgi:DNA polymerase-3 subunit epsilon